MPHRPHRLVSLVVLLATAGLLVSCGDRESPAASAGTGPAATTPNAPPGTSPGPATPTPSTPHKITWVYGFDAGAKKAESEDELLFVYVARHRPT